jgi:hypothetical protein
MTVIIKNCVAKKKQTKEPSHELSVQQKYLEKSGYFWAKKKSVSYNSCEQT